MHRRRVWVAGLEGQHVSLCGSHSLTPFHKTHSTNPFLLLSLFLSFSLTNHTPSPSVVVVWGALRIHSPRHDVLHRRRQVHGLSAVALRSSLTSSLRPALLRFSRAGQVYLYLFVFVTLALDMYVCACGLLGSSV